MKKNKKVNIDMGNPPDQLDLAKSANYTPQPDKQSKSPEEKSKCLIF